MVCSDRDSFVVDLRDIAEDPRYIVHSGLLHMKTFPFLSNKSLPIVTDLAARDQVNSSNWNQHIHSHGTPILAIHIQLLWVFSTDNSSHIDMFGYRMPELLDRALQPSEGKDIHIDRFPR